MPKAKKRIDPNSNVHDQFRSVSAGNVHIPVNSRPLDSGRYIDRSRLGVHSEYDPTAPNEFGGTGRYVEALNSPRRHAIAAMGDIMYKSAYRNCDEKDKDPMAPCCDDVPYRSSSRNPMYKKRAGD